MMYQYGARVLPLFGGIVAIGLLAYVVSSDGNDYRVPENLYRPMASMVIQETPESVATELTARVDRISNAFSEFNKKNDEQKKDDNGIFIELLQSTRKQIDTIATLPYPNWRAAAAEARDMVTELEEKYFNLTQGKNYPT